MSDTFDLRHPHEPEIPPTLDDEGRCLVCLLLVRVGDLTVENDRLRDALQDIEGIVRSDTIASKGLAVLDRIAQVLRPSGNAAQDAP